METWLVLIFAVIVLWIDVMNYQKIKALESKLEDYRAEMQQLSHTRQGTLKRPTAYGRIPGVDFKPRVKNKPQPAKGGRMSTAVHRTESTNERDAADS